MARREGRADASEPLPALVERAAAGDRAAFSELYQRHASLVFRRLTRLIGPVAEREDLLQQVFLKLYRALPGFRGEASFETFLSRIAVSVAYDHLRRVRHSPLRSASPDGLADLPAADDTDAAARRASEVRRLLALLDRLKPKKRVAFALFAFEGLSIEEIAALVGAREAAVRQRINHAGRELRRMMAAGRKEDER
jgi:RNA polymerase sigma-70 factor, ECF subfamily